MKTTSRKVRWHIFKRDNHQCRYCLRPAGDIDHVIPRHHGGIDAEDNLVAACRRCNSLVGKKSFDSFESKKSFILGAIEAKRRGKIYGFARKLANYLPMVRVSPGDLCRKTDISPERLSDILAGSRHPQARDIVAIERSLGIQFDPEDFEEEVV